MPTTRGSSSGGVSTVDQAGGGQQPDPSMDADPTNNLIDVDEDNDRTQAEPTLFLYIRTCPGGRACITTCLTRMCYRKKATMSCVHEL